MAAHGGGQLFRLILIKPSHYDDDGYVIQWLRSPIPANSLACLYGLARDCRGRAGLGPDVDLDILAIDETNTRIRLDKIARQVKQADQGLVMLVGVQSNQFPRALDIATRLRQIGVTVGIGGFHVSGTLAMLPTIEPSVQCALDMGGSVRARASQYRLSWNEANPGHAACRMASTVAVLRRWSSLRRSAGTCGGGRGRRGRKLRSSS